MKSSLRFKILIAFAALAISGLALAQDDPPSRVMRLQYLQGEVSLQPGGVDDWVAAGLNRPLTTSDRIWTDRDARAELTMASAALRMGSETSVTITSLNDTTSQIELDQGVLNLSVRYLSAGEIVEVDTPNFAYTVTRPGDYRFDVVPDQDESWITVRHGDGEATGQGNAVRVHTGQQFRFGGGQSLSYTQGRMPDPDGFDDWCAVRERRETSSTSARYVAAGTVGYEDLDDSGYWEPTPEYGVVWYPRMHSGWAPYREGHWAWIEPWGWTWVDDAPWGFAPFHYGRWVCVHDRWGWIPGPVAVRPVYAPALVAWVGGPSFGVSVGIGGGVGWFPLGWHDPYIPAYRVSPVYARNVNISNSRVVNTTIINNYYSTTNVNVRNTTINNIRYENVAVRGAVTGVQSNTFAAGRPVRGNAVVVPPNAVGRVNVMTTAAVVPTREAVLGGRPPARVPQHVVVPQRDVVSRIAPPPRPVKFDQQRPLLEKTGGVPLDAATRNELRRANPAPAPRGGQPSVAPANAGTLPGVGRPDAQPRRGPVAEQPAANQQQINRPRVVNRPEGNQQVERPGYGNQASGANQQVGRPPITNQPWANQPQANQQVPRPNAPSNVGRQVPQADSSENVNPGGRYVPRPAQASGSAQAPVARPNDNQVNTQRPPASSYGNTGRSSGEPDFRQGTPVRDTPPPVRAVTPTHNATPNRDVAPTREMAPAAPVRNQQPAAAPARNTQSVREAAPQRPQPQAREAAPPREAAPARNVQTERPQAEHRNAPLSDNKDKDKKDK